MDSTLCIPHLVEFWNLPNTMYTKYVPRSIFEERSVCEQSSVVFSVSSAQRAKARPHQRIAGKASKAVT